MREGPRDLAPSLDIDPLRAGPAPVPAATVVLLRDSARGLEALLVQRHRATAFMGGAHVFPGGKLALEDASEAVRARCVGPSDETLRHALGPSEEIDAVTARALHVAAIRETFEEAGVLLGTSARARGALDAARARLNAGQAWDEVLGSLDASLALSRLVPLSRWVTPAVEKRRFDARFFLCVVSREESEHASSEAHETIASRWLSPREAIALHEAASIDLPPPTLRTLELLTAHRRSEDAVLAARASTPPLVCPVFHATEAGWILALPGDSMHPDGTPALGGSTRFVCRDGRWFSS
ncbi:MAG: NUDIX hydrolase [Deltaproteobacteria bacterium]